MLLDRPVSPAWNILRRHDADGTVGPINLDANCYMFDPFYDALMSIRLLLPCHA